MAGRCWSLWILGLWPFFLRTGVHRLIVINERHAYLPMIHREAKLGHHQRADITRDLLRAPCRSRDNVYLEDSSPIVCHDSCRSHIVQADQSLLNIADGHNAVACLEKYGAASC